MLALALTTGCSNPYAGGNTGPSFADYFPYRDDFVTHFVLEGQRDGPEVLLSRESTDQDHTEIRFEHSAGGELLISQRRDPDTVYWTDIALKSAESWPPGPSAFLDWRVPVAHRDQEVGEILEFEEDDLIWTSELVSEESCRGYDAEDEPFSCRVYVFEGQRGEERFVGELWTAALIGPLRFWLGTEPGQLWLQTYIESD